MPELMGNARSMLAMCAQAAEGALDDSQQSALVSQITGSFAAMPVVGSNIVSLARKRDWYGLMGAIGSYIDVSEAGARTVSVSASATAEATVNLDMSVFFSAEDAIREDSGLTDARKDDLVRLLRDVATSAQRADSMTAAAKLVQLLELGADAVTIMAWLGPLLTQVGLMLSH